MKDNMAFTSPLVQEQLGFFTGMLQGKVENPKLAAYALLDNTINQQAFIIAINNIFILNQRKPIKFDNLIFDSEFR